jgi:hypothetical protein
MPPAMSSSQPEEACGSASETDHQAVAREAAIQVQEDFDASSEFRDVHREAAIALYDPEEVLMKDVIYSGFFCTLSVLRGISLRPSDFEDYIEEHRDRFAGRSHDGHYALKYISPESVKKDEETARNAGAALMIEAKMLMNLAPHPHICQLYGLNASGTSTAFGSKIAANGFFLIIDSISETLPQRIAAWREKKCYHEGERFDDLKTRQSQLTQRLEVAFDICSPMVFLAKRNIVYCFHPEKCGFDSRYKRIKLFHFGQARESGKDPYSNFIDGDMRYRGYLAPEIFKKETVTCDADVYAFGMLLWEILTLKHPLEGMSNGSHLTQVVNGRTRPPINKTWPANLRKLIESCWTATDRPTMKEVYDTLENCLLFQQDFEGIDRTEDHSGMAPQAKSTRRRIKYERPNETIIKEEGDKDSKSVRSRESARSRDTKTSVRSNRSHDSAENKTERRAHRKSADQVSVEESPHQASQEDNSTQKPSRRSDRERARRAEKDGSQRQRPSRQLSRDRVEKPEDDKGEPSLPKVTKSSPDEMPVEDATETKSPSRVKDKNGKIRRRKNPSAEDVIGNDDDDDQSSGRRSTSSRLSSVKDKDGKIRRTAAKPDTSNDDNESTARRSVGSNESLSQRRRSSRRVSKSNLHDTLEGLGKDEDLSKTSETCSWTLGSEEADGAVRGVRRTKSGTSQTDELSDGRETSNLRRAGRRPNLESNGKDESGGRVVRRGVARSKSSDDGFLTHQASSRRVAGSGINDSEESRGRLASSRRGVARSKSSEGTIDHHSSSSSSRRLGTSAENDESGGRVAGASSRRNMMTRSKASDDGALNQAPSRRPVSRRKSGENNALTLMAAATATTSREAQAPATRGIGRHRSNNTTSTTHPASGHPASQRRVGRSASSGDEKLGITDWLGDSAPVKEPRRQGGFGDFGGSTRDLGFIERQNKKASQGTMFSLSMSDHSNWVDLASADNNKKQEEKDPAVNLFAINKTEKLRFSENDTKSDTRKRVIEKAKEMAKEKEERERAARGLPNSEESQRRRVQVSTVAAAGRGLGLSRQKSKRKVKRTSANGELTAVAKLLSVEHQ